MITDQQFRRLKMELKNQATVKVASAKAGVCEKTGHKYKNQNTVPSQTTVAHEWKTRKDPFEEVLKEVEELLKTNNGLESKTIFSYLMQKFPGKFQESQLRTLQRRVKYWRATEGPNKEVIFPQIHYPGDLAASDFTHMGELGITINGEPFDHMIYHFVLTYSNWETGSICFSESFESFSEGFQNAIWELGGTPKRHRSDNFSAAITTVGDKQEFTSKHKGLLAHYEIDGEHIQSRKPHENGDSEQSHHRFKRAVEQSLMLRCHADFRSRAEYEAFLKRLFNQLNQGRKQRLSEELKHLHKLPLSRLEDYSKVQTTVGPSSTVRLKHNTYSVPSRLIRERVEAKLYSAHIEIWYGQKKVDSFRRLIGRNGAKINYRHVIDSLVRKPGAFENYRYRSEMFPSSRFRLTYDYFKKCHGGRASKEYLKILYHAAYSSEEQVDKALSLLLATRDPFDIEAVKKLIHSVKDASNGTEKIGHVATVDLTRYDHLITEKEQAHVV